MKVSFYSTYLPQIGGISIHVQRLVCLLKSEGKLDLVYCTNISNLKKENHIVDVSYPSLKYGFFKSAYWMIKELRQNKSDLIHFHINPIWHAFSIYILSKFSRKFIVCTLHDQMMLENFNNYPWPFRLVFERLKQKRNIRWIAVSSKIHKQLITLGFSTKSIFIIPAFLPAEVENKHDAELMNYIKTKKIVFSLYAHSTATYNNKDLYGIDQAIRMLGKLKLLDFCLVVCIPGEISRHAMEYYNRLMLENDVVSNILFYLKPLNNVNELLLKSDILLRPTLTDGDSLMVREALSIGTPVVASDVVERPEGVVGFITENIDDFYLKVMEVLSCAKLKSQPKITCDNFNLIKEVYYSFYK